MRLSTNEIRARAAAFVASWTGAAYEKGETQSFYNDFFAIFGRTRREVGIYEQNVRKLDGSSGFIDLFWPGTLLVEQKSAGRDLARARVQAMAYINALPPEEQPKFLLLSDFQTFELLNFDSREETSFPLADLPRHVANFDFILGRTVARFKDQDPVNIRAAELVGLLHDALKASGYTGHRLEVFLTRIVFCLFADDTGIFEPKDILWSYLEGRTAPDGTDLGGKLADLFETLNTPEDRRQTTLDEDLARFPYINGHLFAEYFPTPKFNADMRAALLNACRFDWTPISPAIFGSLFQSVMDAGERRRAGAHYTTEKNILKLIGPLFLDDLRAEFARIKALKTNRPARLAAFHDKLATLTFFDPACGCGNFLIIAYRELRLLELELLKEIHATGQRNLDASVLSRVDVDQFYGIEISEFPARIAETAMWMMDHLMNLALSEAFGGYYPRIPLKKSPTILHGDALEVDWESVLPAARCSYVLGNPPFIGAKFQSVQQREQVRAIANLGKSGGTLDFVCAWFLKAGAYVDAASPPTQPPPRGGRGTAAPLSAVTHDADPLPPSPHVG
uniref:DNA methyltransferase n=1 Tax=Tabrizicola sp. TaxID=2005166 RepID=UPI003863D2C0